jgi:hypothetical protein
MGSLGVFYFCGIADTAKIKKHPNFPQNFG